MSTTITTRSSNSPDTYKDKALSNTVVGATSVPTELCGWRIINPNSTTCYVKFYNGSSGDITLGVTEPIKEFLVASGSEIFLESDKDNPQMYFQDAMSIVAVTGLATSSTGKPILALDVEIYYYKPHFV